MRRAVRGRIGAVRMLIIALILATMGGAGQADAAKSSQPIPLQALIDAAEPGSEIVLEDGSYTGPAVIDKPLVLQGREQATISGGTGEALLTVRSTGVELRGLTIVHDGTEKSSAIAVEADNVVIERTTIETTGLGISLRDSNRAVISGNKVYATGRGKASSRTGNGIDLYESHVALIEGNEVHGMKDGIYLERSHRAVVEANRIYYSRYGIHCMYTDGTVVRGNEGEFNVTGAMVMGVRDAVVENNTFRKQSGNVHSQGLLLFDVQTSLIEHNTLEGNRVGIYMELSSDNRLAGNDVRSNFVGVQFLEAANNVFTGNRFLSNVIEAQATDSAGNRLDGNYWDALQPLDKDGDGISDLSYAINPFFERVVGRTPAFQLFFQSPSMTFLSGLFTADKADWAYDAAPLANKPEGLSESEDRSGERNSSVGLVGIALMFGAMITIYLGVKKS